MNDKRILLILGAVALGLLFLCGGAGALGFLASRSLPGGSGGLGGEWYTAQFCLVDANGDGVLDVAGFSGTPSAQTTATALDGRTGRVLWQGETYHEGSTFHCGDERTVLVSRPGFHLEGLDARTGKRRWIAALSDDVQSASPGRGCVELVLKNQKHDGIQLATGAHVACTGDKGAGGSAMDRMLQAPDPSLALTWQTKSNDIDVGLSTHMVGTQVLEVTAARGGKRLWSKRLDVQSELSTEPFLGATKDVIVVGGFDLVDKEYLVWIGLSPTTGKQLYRRRESSHWSSFFPHAKIGRGVLYSYWGCGMSAIEPKTGKRLWQFGGR